MRRGYTRESYLELVNHIRELIPDIQLSSDFIAGFCGETDAEFEDTITLMEQVQYHVAYLFQYSMREKTTAHRRFQDDVPPEVKLERMQRMANLFRSQAEKLNSQLVGTRQLVLVEGVSFDFLSAVFPKVVGNFGKFKMDFIENFPGYNFGPEVNRRKTHGSWDIAGLIIVGANLYFFD